MAGVSSFRGSLSHSLPITFALCISFLNNVSRELASGRVVATDFQRGYVVVENKGGQTKTLPLHIATSTGVGALGWFRDSRMLFLLWFEHPDATQVQC